MKDGFKGRSAGFRPHRLITGLLSYYIIAFTFMDPSTINWVVYAGIVGALSGRPHKNEQHRQSHLLLCGVPSLIAAAQYLRYRGIARSSSASSRLRDLLPNALLRADRVHSTRCTPRQITVTFSAFWAIKLRGSVVIIMIFAAIADATVELVANFRHPGLWAPMIFIVFAEATFLIGTFLIWRWFKAERTGGGVAGLYLLSRIPGPVEPTRREGCRRGRLDPRIQRAARWFESVRTPGGGCSRGCGITGWDSGA